MKTSFRSMKFALISLIVLQLACSLLGITPETSTESETVPAHSGVFLKEENTFVEVPLSEGMPEKSDSENIPTSSSSSPEIVVWQSNVNLDYLYVRRWGLSGDQVDISVSQVDEGTLTITFSASLEPGTYCLIQGDPLGSPYSLPTWCFQIDRIVSENTPRVEARETEIVVAPTQSLSYQLVVELTIPSDVGNFATDVEWSPDGNHIVIYTQLRRTRVGFLYDIQSQTFEPIELDLVDIAWGPDGKRIAYLDDKSTITIVDSYSSETIQSYIYTEAENDYWGLSDIDWSPDGKAIASITRTGMVDVSDVLSGNQIFGFSYFGDNEKPITVNFLDWSSDSKKLAVGTVSNLYENRVQIWDIQSGSMLDEFNLNKILNYDSLLSVWDLAWNPDGITFAVVTDQNNAVLINTETGDSVVIDPDAFFVENFAWHPAGNMIALGGLSGVTFWDTDSNLIANLEIGSSQGLAWNKDGNQLATTTTSRDGDILRIWKIEQ